MGQLQPRLLPVVAPVGQDHRRIGAFNGGFQAAAHLNLCTIANQVILQVCANEFGHTCG
jgi:hypothetical protein